jgi:AraC-like DNA-binding protein
LVLEPVLQCLVEKLLRARSDLMRKEQLEALAGPIHAWQSSDVADYLDRLRRMTDDEYMGLGTSPCPRGSLHLIVELSTRCSTLRDAAEMSFRTMGLLTSALRFQLTETAELAIIDITEETSEGDPEHALADWAMLVWYKLLQWLIGEEIWLDRAELDHPLDGPYSAYAKTFGGDCLFNSSSCRLVFARSYLNRRIVRTPDQAHRLIATRFNDFGGQSGLFRTWKQQIRDILRADIASGKSPSTIEKLAADFATSSQTLRRRLKAEGACYRSLKAEARREVAIEVLADHNSTVSQASFAAGFAEPTGLGRALKASRGMNSAKLREQVRGWVPREVA